MAKLDNTTIVTISGIDLEIVYDIHEAEPETREHPGSPKSISIIQILIYELDISSIISEDREEEIKQIIINQ